MYPRIEKWAFDTTVRPPVYVEQAFIFDSAGLVHYVDGVNRAMIETPHILDYCDTPNIRQALSESEYAEIVAAYPRKEAAAA